MYTDIHSLIFKTGIKYIIVKRYNFIYKIDLYTNNL